MKKSTIWIIIAVVIVVIGAVFFMTRDKGNEDADVPSEEVSEEVSEEAEAPSEETEKPSEETEEAPSEEVPVEEAEEAKVNYAETDITEWMKTEGDTDEMTAKLINIDMVQYGTAGSSLKMASAGVDMLDLSNAENAADTVKAYLEGMTDIQKDYFSFQWGNVYKSASSILEKPEEMKDLLSDAGVENFDASLYTKESLESLNTSVLSILDEMGVSDEWKNFSDVEPFNMVNE